jgi:predicted CoA-binding protein
MEEAVGAFLASRRIAVAGVSRSGKSAADAIYEKLRSTGHEVIPVNPRADELRGVRCFPDLRSVPGGVDALLIATPPSAALGLVRECRELGIRRVWMHRSFGTGSVAEDAVRYCREHDMSVIPGACPMMYCAPVDPFHACLRHVLRWFGRMPTIPH